MIPALQLTLVTLQVLLLVQDYQVVVPSGAVSLALSHLGLESLSDPDDDRILFWDDSAGTTAFRYGNRLTNKWHNS